MHQAHADWEEDIVAFVFASLLAAATRSNLGLESSSRVRLWKIVMRKLPWRFQCEHLLDAVPTSVMIMRPGHSRSKQASGKVHRIQE